MTGKSKGDKKRATMMMQKSTEDQLLQKSAKLMNKEPKKFSNIFAMQNHKKVVENLESEYTDRTFVRFKNNVHVRS